MCCSAFVSFFFCCLYMTMCLSSTARLFVSFSSIIFLATSLSITADFVKLVAPTKSSNTCCDNSDAELANVSTWYGLNTSLTVNLCVVTLARAIGFSSLPKV